MARNIQAGRAQFPYDQFRFTTEEAARYCGYKSKTGFTHHVYNTKMIEPDEKYERGKKVILLIFFRHTLEKFIMMREEGKIRPGPTYSLDWDDD